MFAYVYQLCLAIFLIQGISTPFLILILGLLWRRQTRRLEALGEELGAGRAKGVKSGESFGSLLEGLPKLRPLSCARCGGSLLLEEAATFCPYCQTRGDLPEDYAAAVSLRPQIKSLLKSALRHWRVANVLTCPAVGCVFFLLIFIEPLVLFPVVLIGSNTFPETRFDKALAAMGETAAFLVMLSAFLGFIVWMIVFMFLAGLSRNLRAKLPAVPVLERGARGSERSNCRSCGGGIEYDAGDFACLCTYCNVANFRVQFAGRERARVEKQAAATKSVLFGAMQIIEDYVGTAFFVLVILVGACVLLTLFYAVKNLD